MIKTAIIGASGYVGRHLLSAYRRAFPDCVGTAFENPSPGLVPFDVRNPDIGPLRLFETGHRAVVIAAARPNVDYCERNRQAAYEVNVLGTLELIRQLGNAGLRVIFFSSDYVFDGRTGGYADTARPSANTEYGRQKATVERQIDGLCDDSLVVRLSKIIGTERNDGTVLDEIANRLCNDQEVLAAHDQVFSPTLVQDVVHGIHALQENHWTGIVNLSSPEAWSRYELAVALARELGHGEPLIRRISLSDLPLACARPNNTSLRCKRLTDELALRFTPISQCISRTASNWKDAADER